MKRIKRKIKNFLLRHLFDAIVEDDFFVYKKGKLFYKGKEIARSDYNKITANANVLKKNDVYVAILRELKFLAKERIFYNNDIEFGKAMLYSISLIENKINFLSRLK